MGFNTVAVLYNDHSDSFRRSGPLGQRIAFAMNNWTNRERDSLATDFGAGKIISQAHADYYQVVVAGMNSGCPIEEADNLDWMALDRMAECLKRHGYRVSR